jgi:hypothetical protein
MKQVFTVAVGLFSMECAKNVSFRESTCFYILEDGSVS